jgi:hypothetical protein
LLAGLALFGMQSTPAIATFAVGLETLPLQTAFNLGFIRDEAEFATEFTGVRNNMTYGSRDQRLSRTQSFYSEQ